MKWAKRTKFLLYGYDLPVRSAGIGHGVAGVAVGGNLHDDGPVLRAVLLAEPRGLSHGKHVHSVNLIKQFLK